MQRLFGQNTIVQVVTLLAVMAMLWARPLAQAAPMAAADGYAPLYTALLNLHIPSTLAIILAILLILLGGFYLNVLLVRTNLTRQNSLLPTFLYCLFMSATATTLSPTLLANLLILPILNLLLLRGTLLTVSSDKIFGVAALIAIASMVYLPMLSLLIAYLLVAINYRLYSWREWAILLLGLLAPYILLWGFHFATGTLADCFAAIGQGLADLDIRISHTSTPVMLANLLLVAVAAWSIFSLWNRLGEHPVAWQKNAVTVMLAAVSGLVMLFYSTLMPANLQLFAAPFALCGTRMLSTPQRSHHRQRRQWTVWVNDTILILIVIAAIVC